MDFVKVNGPGLSGVEIVVLAVLVLLCIGVGWAMYRKSRGDGRSDVSGLRLKHREPGTS